MTTADWYVEFAAREARGVSPTYQRLSYAVSRDEQLLALLDTLPPAKRQPNLLFGVVRGLPGHWVASEAPDVLSVGASLQPPSGAAYHLVAVDGTPVAWARPHGQALHWFG